MSQETKIASSSVLELHNVPTELILYAIQQWEYCGLYAKATGTGKATNQFIKGISVWIILKNLTTSGCFHNYRDQLPELAATCKMSVRTLQRYLSWLKKMDLISIQLGGLYMRNYTTLRRLNIDINDRESTILYDTNSETSLAEMLVAIGIQRMKNRWMNVYWKKLNRNQDEYMIVYDLLVKHGADPSRLQDKEYFRQCHLELMCQAYEEEKPGLKDEDEFSIFKFLHNDLKANPDINAKAETYATRFGYQAAMSFCHLKFKLIKRGLVNIKKDHVEGFNRARKDEKIFHHRWLREFKHTIWFRCDQITILTQQIFKMKTA